MKSSPATCKVGSQRGSPASAKLFSRRTSVMASLAPGYEAEQRGWLQARLELSGLSYSITDGPLHDCIHDEGVYSLDFTFL
jgi:hypothetical protein